MEHNETHDREARPAGLVLIHGAFHTARCWSPTVTALARQAPDVQVVAVDLPGRGTTPGDLSTLTIAEAADAVVAAIERAGLDEVVLVAHSLAGLVAPEVAGRLGASRVARLVLLAAVVPPEGASNLALIPRPARWVVGRMLRPGSPRRPPPRPVVRMSFCNGMTREQRELVYSQLCDEAPGLFHEPVSRAGLPGSVPRAWILLTRDRANPPRMQRAGIRNLGDVDEVLELDTCHDAMITEPAKLASILAERCRRGVVPRSARGR